MNRIRASGRSRARGTPGDRGDRTPGNQRSRSWRNPRRIRALLGPSLLIAVSILAAVVVVNTAADRTLTQLELALLQFFMLAAGLSGSYLFGKHATRTGARELVKAHARPAFRRLLNLYNSLSRLAGAIGRERERHAASNDPGRSLDILDAIVTEQILTASDALEDWRDIVPEDVKEVEKRLKERQPSGTGRS